MKVRWNHYEKHQRKRKRSFEKMLKDYLEDFKETQQTINKQRAKKGLN
jgi:flagellar hook-basal body complex protein FliE